MFFYNRKPIENIIKSKQEIIDRFNKNGYTVIHLFGDLYLVRNYSKNHPKHKYFSLYNLEIIR